MSEQFLYFLQQMFNGVTLGSTYALIAIGYTMVYGIIGMINFAHGEVYMIGSYVSFMIIAALMMMGIDTGWLLVAAGFVGAIVIASAYGWSIERVAYRPVRNSKRLIALISAIGMSIFLQNYVSLTEGSRDVALPSLFNGQWVVGHSENFSASITTMQAVIWIVTFLAMLALTIFIRYSRMGRACRACAEDLKMASLLGINTDRVIALTFVIGAAMAAAAGFLLGFPVLRLRGDYLAIVTLGFGEIVRILLLNNTEITGGPNGISQIPKPTLFGLEFSRTAREGGWDTFSNFFGLKYDPSDRVIFLYLVALLLVVLSLFVINRLLRMPLGRAWEALREDEIACRSLGLSPRRIKLTAFTISAAFAGFAGTLFAARQGFVSPESFTFAESAFVLAIVVLGGMGSQFAVILAAILLVVSRELMRDFNEYSMLMLGGLMVLMMIWRPQGLLPMTRPQLKLKNGAAKGEQA